MFDRVFVFKIIFWEYQYQIRECFLVFFYMFCLRNKKICLLIIVVVMVVVFMIFIILFKVLSFI